MPNKKEKAPESKEKNPVEKKIEVMMGGPSQFDDPEGPVVTEPKSASKISIETPEDTEPLTAPIIPTDAFPKEVREDKKTKAAAAKKPKPIVIHDASGDDEPTDEPLPAEVEADPISKQISDEVADDSKESEPEVQLASSEEAEPEVQTVASVDDSLPEPNESPEDKNFQDADTDKAVDDIAAQEATANEAVSIEDSKPASPKKKGKLRRFLSAWWHNPVARWATILLVLGVIGGSMAYPTTRYFVLNTAGVRASASVAVFDESTQQPLKNVQVKIAGQATKTDGEGNVKLTNLKLGPTSLNIERRAFAPISKQVIVGWGSNPFGDFKLAPTGAQYTFVVTDFLSGKPVTKAEATSDDGDDANATADDTGKIVLTVDKMSDQDLTVTIRSDTYRDETVTFDADNKEQQELKLVPSRKHTFISKRSGKYDLYAIDVDGKNEKVLLSGTGNERSDITLVSHPTGDTVALVSTRDNVRNKDGYLLSTLTLMNTSSGQKVELGKSEKIQIVDWSGDRLIYVQVAAGASASNPQRHRLTAYDYKTEDKKELASSNYFNDVLVANGAIYYAPSAAYQESGVDFYKVNPDGSGKQTLINKEVWNIFRTSYDKLSLSVGQDWYEYKLGELQAGKVSGAPPELKSRLYRDSPDKQHSLWVDTRDGKGVLVEYGAGEKKDKTLLTESGISNPVYWLNDTYIVYRVHTDRETADYVMNTDGGEPQKIRDATNASGVEQWYYYQ